jgi:protein ImuB
VHGIGAMARTLPRIACICSPLFPLAVRLRSEPELLHEALAIFEGNGNRARVIAATRAARKAGVRPGHSLPQARALVPKLIARARDPECESTGQEVLLETAESFSPRVEAGEPGIAYLDIQGLERQFPGEDTEHQIGRALVRALDKEGLPARVGIAANKLAAHIASGLLPTPTIVPAGEEEAFLSPLPLQRLTPAMEVAETLERWGIKTVGEFGRIPAPEVTSRLGESGSELHASARGVDLHPLMPRVPPPDFREGMNLEWPLVTLEPFLFLARAALERLCRRLDTQGLGCARLDFSLRLEPEGFHERSINLPSPTCDVKTLLTLVRLDLEASAPGSPVTGFSFSAHPDRPRAAQLSLFGATALSPEKLATTLARLFALLGPGRAGSPQCPDGHRPERFAMLDFHPAPPPRVRPEPAQARGLLAIRVLRPPREIRVRTRPRESDCRRPVFLAALESGEKAAHKSELGRVRVAAGPWELEEGWWTSHPVRREYWDVEIESGGLYRVYRDRKTQRWFVDGIYD